jgi:precorrin-2 methylase
MKKGARQLESRLKRADVVLCPVNCNSHNACSVVKNLAKKHQKTVHMLANSSLKAVTQAIWGTGDGRHMVN